MPILNPALAGFYEADYRYYVLYGGRASSKTYHTAGFLAFLAAEYSVRVLCTRQFQSKIADSVKQVIEEAIYAAGLQDEYQILESGIKHLGTGSEFLFYGIQRNIREIKGLASIDILWVEECESLTKEQWEVIMPTVREEGSRIILVFNPRLATDFVWQNFVVNPQANSIVRKINYDENPYLSSTMRTVIEDCRVNNPDDFAHIYLGEPMQDDERVIIKRSWIEAAIDAHIKLGFEPMGEKRVGFDVADDGADKCANVYSHGSVALWCEEWKAGEDELLKSCSRTYQNALSYGANIQYDSIGVGAGCGAKFDEINEAQGKNVQYYKFNAGAGVFEPERYYAENRLDRIKNKDYFSNLKAQTWWLIADRFRNTFDAIKNGTQYKPDELISIASTMPDLEKLKTELSTPKRDFDANGRVKVESKKDLAKREVKSPNLADGFVMCFAPAHRLMIISTDALKEAQRR